MKYILLTSHIYLRPISHLRHFTCMRLIICGSFRRTEKATSGLTSASLSCPTSMSPANFISTTSPRLRSYPFGETRTGVSGAIECHNMDSKCQGYKITFSAGLAILVHEMHRNFKVKGQHMESALYAYEDLMAMVVFIT